MKFILSSLLIEKFPDTIVAFGIAENAKVFGTNDESNNILKNIYPEVIRKYQNQGLKNNENSQAYISFCKAFGISPDSAFLPHLQIKRVLKGKGVGNINSVVNLYMAYELLFNLSLGAYDLNTFSGDIAVDISKGGEKMTTIGGDQVTLKTDDLIFTDSNGPFQSFSQGYKESTKVTSTTKNVLFTVNAPKGKGISLQEVEECIEKLASNYEQSEYIILTKDNSVGELE